MKMERLILDAGLTPEEADGLIASWRPQFFNTPGRRFIRVMTSKEYDAICPIKINPQPTQLVRVGLVLSEFAWAGVHLCPRIHYTFPPHGVL